jgi:hypothetical protein
MLAFFDPMCAIKSDALSDPRAAHEQNLLHPLHPLSRHSISTDLVNNYLTRKLKPALSLTSYQWAEQTDCSINRKIYFS